MPQTKSERDQLDRNIQNALNKTGEPGATSTTSSPGPGAQSPQATINQTSPQAPTQAAVERALKGGGKK